MRAKQLLWSLLGLIPLLADPCIQGTPSHIGIGTRQGKGMGYEHGYTTLSTFVTPNWQRNFQPIFDARLHFLNNATWATNVGGATRYAISNDYALGANFFYDFRNTKGLTAHQLGGGLELLNTLFDIYINGYAPIVRTKDAGSFKFDRVTGHNIFLKQNVYFALAHIEALAGFWFPPSWPIDIYWAAGPYYLFGRDARVVSCGGSWGAKTFLEATISNGVVLGGQWTYDDEYHGRLQGYLQFSFPLGPNNIRRGSQKWKDWYSPQCQDAAVKQRLLTGPIRRDEIIPICDKVDRPLPLSILPSVPDPAPPCFFVNNSLATNGDGTFENPFNNLASAEAASAEGDCIYVYFGTGATTPGYDTGFLLKNNQLIQGSGFDLIIDGVNALPAQTPGLRPTLSGAPGFAITLANGNTVNGFDFDTVAGIFGANAVGGMVTNNTFTGQDLFGRAIDIQSATSDFFITNNQFTNTIEAIRVQDQNSGSLFVSNNTFFNRTIPTGPDLIFINVDNSGTVIIENNTIDSPSQQDVFFVGFGSTTPGAFGNVIIRNNNIIHTFAPNPSDEPVLTISNTGTWSGATVIFTNNTVETGSGIPVIVAASSALTTLQFTNNVFTVTDPAPNFLFHFGGGDSCLNYDGNIFTNATFFFSNGGPGFMEVSPGSAAALSAANNGIPVITAGAVTFNATLPQPQCTP